MVVLALPCDGLDSSRSLFESRQSFCNCRLKKIITKHKTKYKKGPDGLLPIKTTCAKLLYFSDYDSLRDVRQKTH
jgi:hypothetical protein